MPTLQGSFSLPFLTSHPRHQQTHRVHPSPYPHGAPAVPWLVLVAVEGLEVRRCLGTRAVVEFAVDGAVADGLVVGGSVAEGEPVDELLGRSR